MVAGASGVTTRRGKRAKTGIPAQSKRRHASAMANILTLARIVLIVPFVALFLADASWNMNAALVVFIIAALTDFLDGRVARARGEVSALGAALDPLADKLLIAAALILLVRNGVIAGAGVVAVIAIILREMLVSGLREAVTARGGALPVMQLREVENRHATCRRRASPGDSAARVFGRRIPPDCGRNVMAGGHPYILDRCGLFYYRRTVFERAKRTTIGPWRNQQI